MKSEEQSWAVITAQTLLINDTEHAPGLSWVLVAYPVLVAGCSLPESLYQTLNSTLKHRPASANGASILDYHLESWSSEVKRLLLEDRYNDIIYIYMYNIYIYIHIVSCSLNSKEVFDCAHQQSPPVHDYVLLHDLKKRIWTKAAWRAHFICGGVSARQSPFIVCAAQVSWNTRQARNSRN